ncbi:baseplate protein [Pasteurella canis]|uniref:Gp138 family membrane-puncturing spike protein n=1 Tax=Pasteurella canis TaxID=753 RepID=UPI001E35350A|nr:Gp138 family membrane-puncturing spike protein [Pasteurella canis]UEA17449.1 baseplate protein [Pasteurella canis]
MPNYNTHLATPETAADEQIKYAQMNLHTSLPAKVVNFDPANQTVTLAIQIKQVLKDGNAVQIPPLVYVPVSFPRGGSFAFTFPLTAGDEGIALFSERCIDGWWQSSKAAEPLDYRFHDLSDAMFIPGICSVPNAVKGFFMNGLSMQTLDGSTFIRVTNGTIFIQGDVNLKGNMSHDGDTSQNGAFSATGVISSDSDITAAGISGKSHVHTGVANGPSTTGGPR